MPAEFAKTPLQERFSRTRGWDPRIADLATGQHGVVGRRQLLRLGIGEGAIEGWVQRGQLHRLHAGTYAVGHTVVSRRGRWMAAVLARAPDACLSHWSAAALWAIRPSSRQAVDVTLPRRSRSSALIHCHLACLPEDERTAEDGIPVTTVPRTIFDLAAGAPGVVDGALGEAEYLRLYDRLSLRDLLERYPHHRGVVAVRATLARREADAGGDRGAPGDRVRSPLEERFLPFVDRHGLPRPQLNAAVEAGARWHQVDCLWPERRQIVELDGWAGHSTRRAFREDRARDRRLRAAGYGVARLTWGQLDDEPEAVAADLRTLLGTSRS